jgi:ABC-type bacteriocin/lantibiotic exporter with double-glycine peptidase domain
VFASISSLYFLAIGISFFFINILIIALMIRYSRKLFNFKRKYRSKSNSFIKKIINHRNQINAMKKNDFIFKEFVKLNKD